MKKAIIGMLAAALACISGYAIGHGGGLDQYGCHTNHKTGDYHCHGAKRSPPPRPPATANSLYGAQPARAGSVHYANCTEARAAGAAPVRRGDPGYGSHHDRDNDGVGCE